MSRSADRVRAPRSGAAQRPGRVGTASPRVAIVAPSLDILGGQGIQARDLADALSRDGVEVRFVAVNPRFPRGLRWLRRIPVLRTLVNQVFYVFSLFRLRRADVVHVFSASYWSFLLAPVPAILAARGFRKRVILNYHSGEADDHLARWGWRVHPFLRLVDTIVVPSVYLQEVFQAHGYEARVVRNIIDLSAFGYRARLPLGPRLLSCRNLEPHYRVQDVLEAFALVKQRHPEASLRVAGYGSQANRLRTWVEERSVKDVEFLGRVEPGDIAALYDSTDIFLNASVIDNQPISILEAFAAGLAVVTTSVGDIPHMLDGGRLGVIVPRRSPAAMAAAVTTLLESPEQAARMSEEARKEVRRYTWPEVRRAWLEVYGAVDATGDAERWRASNSGESDETPAAV